MRDIWFMKEQVTNELARTFLAVITGVLTAIAVGALLLPVVEVSVNKFFNLHLFTQTPSDASKDDLMPKVTLFSWFFVASFAGGLVCSFISSSKDTIHVLISSLVSIVLIFIMSKGKVLDENQFWSSLLILLSIPLGNVIGGWIGGRLKRKKKSSVSIS